MTAHHYHAAIQPLVLILTTNDGLIERTFQDVPEADLWKRPAPQSNPLLWIFGHLVNTRNGMLGLLGDRFDPGWNDLFSRGAMLQAAGYPTRARIHEVARDVNTRLYARLAELTDADVAATASRAFTPQVRTLGDQLAFLTMHDTYHVGQLAYVRKTLGLPGVAG